MCVCICDSRSFRVYLGCVCVHEYTAYYCMYSTCCVHVSGCVCGVFVRIVYVCICGLYVDNSNRRTFRFLVFPMWTNSSGTLKEKSFWWFVICLERSEWSTEWRNWMSKRWKVEVRAQREVRQGMVGERDSKIAMQFMWLLREKFKGKWGGGWFVVRLYRVTE